jgi:hypothetical protein
MVAERGQRHASGVPDSPYQVLAKAIAAWARYLIQEVLGAR